MWFVHSSQVGDLSILIVLTVVLQRMKMTQADGPTELSYASRSTYSTDCISKRYLAIRPCVCQKLLEAGFC
ncbi:uncharacterized protein BCR38DRAFT_440894 [Pseudomassariella vexata]|uniref:Secreted protein n=1 Tax=Pseudomassariella vexata TaxID=1141098 RepID=A0A1Y2DQW2_9PEZI|nr:uncharacterized protein BCR38DRAFT_440894 [Pseudomassariella vexata]ORY61692.1 hypothetical protein BCR38DRAFT_440894 [Pseudomassariella vexata]